MRHLLIRMPATAALIWLSTNAVGFAQVSPTSGTSATSPLGTGSSSFNTQQNGIPLGATELNPGGLSPLPCAGTTTSGNAPASPLSTFDGGGLTSNSSACGSSAAGNSAGNGGPPQAGSPTGGSTAGNGAIPLGSTELATPGESPIPTNPAPAIPDPNASQPNVAATPTTSFPGRPSPSSPTTPCLGAMNVSGAGALPSSGC
jgi:hypothetical protein